MCGLAAAVGDGPVSPFLLQAIRRLEYRGYDSWGVLTAHANDRAWFVRRRVGHPSDAPRHCEGLTGDAGLAHNRWATHGEVSERNAHPIIGGRDPFGHDLVAVVCNGVIDGHAELRAALADEYEFKTDTDTEALAHLLALSLALPVDDGRLLEWLRAVSRRAPGRYAAVALSRTHPDALLLICNGSPLVVCPAKGLVASDVVAFEGFLGEGDVVTAMAEGQVGILRRAEGADEAVLRLLGEGDRAVPLSPVHFVQRDDSPANKSPGQYMRQEILEQPAVIRAHAELPCSVFEYLDDISLTGCGSSYHAALLGAAYLRAAGTDAFAYLPADLRTGRDGCIAVTQSGETADVLRVLEPYVRDFRGEFYAVTNRPESSVARLANEGGRALRVLEMRCGEERAVAATKSFLASCLCLYALAQTGPDHPGTGFLLLADAVERVLELDISPLVESLGGRQTMFVAGKGLLYPIALEGALKLKECAYKWAEGVSLPELKHGPLALLDLSGFVLGLVQSADELQLISEVHSRGCPLFLLVPDGLESPYPSLALPVSHLHPALRPLAYVVALQRLSLELGLAAGVDPDYPRSLAKCVSV